MNFGLTYHNIAASFSTFRGYLTKKNSATNAAL